MTAFADHLTRYPDDLRARWLLNIAHMTLGQYPAQVPARWLIPPQVFDSDYDIQRFPDVAPGLGLDVEGLAGGTIAEDFDGDGSLDLMLSDWSLKGQLRFFRNQGDGTFEDVPERAGLLSFHPTQTATWFDFNGDGWLDVFIGNESSQGELHPCELHRNNGDGTFTECAQQAGVAVVQFIKGVTSGDFNNDGRPDLYLSNRGGPNLLFRNDGPAPADGATTAHWKFTNVAVSAGVTEPILSFPTWFWDYNNDEWLDFYVGTGDPDLSTLIPNRMFRNDEGKRFQDVTTSGGFGHLQKGHGVAFADFDNDGDQDVFIKIGGAFSGDFARSPLFQNPGHGNHWLTLKLEGQRSNRAANGSR